jgi:hypothetical protein
MMTTEEEDDETPTSARDTRFPLAYDANGNPLDVPYPMH